MSISLVGGPKDDVFVGRQAELSALLEVMARVEEGQPWLVTVEGESGIGKTALVKRGLASAGGFRALSARSDQSETDLEYGVIEQLLRNVDVPLLDRYPLLRGDVVRSSAFAVGAELLAVLGEQLATGPIAMVVDDVQWADRPSVDALSFMLRRLSVEPVLVLLVIRGDRDHLDDATRRMLLGVDQRVHLTLAGLAHDDIAPLAAAIGAPPLPPDALQRLYDGTSGHALYLRTVLSDLDNLGRLGAARLPVPPSLAAAIGDQLTLLPAETRSLLEMLSVVDAAMPLALLGQAAGVASPSAAIEPAVRAGLADLSDEGPSWPVVIRHALRRDGVYAGIGASRRREIHARAVPLVDESATWAHRVASLDHPDEDLAVQLEELAGGEAGRGHLALAATHLLWASDVSPARADRERRLLTAAMHLMLAEEARGLTLRPAVEAAAPSPLRSCVLGTMAFAAGQLREAELRFTEALREVEKTGEPRALLAVVGNRLAGTYTLLGDGEKVIEFSRRALETGTLNPAAESQTRTLIAIGTSQVSGARQALADLTHLDPDPSRVDPVHADGLSFRGVFHLLAGDLGSAVADLTASLKLARRGATMTLGLRAYSYLGLAQYLSGAWDDVLLTSEQGFSAATIRPRRFELPLLHLAAVGVPAGRGATEDAERHAARAEEAAAALDYGQERLYAAMARALVCEASADYAGMVEALGGWQGTSALDGRTRVYEVLWRPLLVEGLLGSGQAEGASAALMPLSAQAAPGSYLQAAIAWFEGWLAEQQGSPERADERYQRGENFASNDSPVYSAHLLFAHGRLLRRTGQRRPAVERLRRAHDLYSAMRAEPFMARTEEELNACGLRQSPTKSRSVFEMTNRETEVAHLIGRGMTNAEIAAELFITPKAVEYHLGNIYAKLGLKGRQQLRRFLGESRRPALV